MRGKWLNPAFLLEMSVLVVNVLGSALFEETWVKWRGCDLERPRCGRAQARQGFRIRSLSSLRAICVAWFFFSILRA